MPGIADKGEGQGLRIVDRAEPAVENDIVLIGPVAGIARHSQADRRPQTLDAIRNETGRERQHLDWKRAAAEPGHLLAGVDDRRSFAWPPQRRSSRAAWRRLFP